MTLSKWRRRTCTRTSAMLCGLLSVLACSSEDGTFDSPGAGASGGTSGASGNAGIGGSAAGSAGTTATGGAGVSGSAGAGLGGSAPAGGSAGTEAGGSAGTEAGGSAGLGGGAGGAGNDAGSAGLGGSAGSSGSAGEAGGGAGGSGGAAGTGGSGGAPADEGCGRLSSLATGHVQMENICRGVVAVRSGSNNFVSWRMFGYEPESVSYNVYRDGTKVTSSPISNSTNYVDNGAPANAKYTVRAVLNGVEQADSEQVSTWAQNYLNIPLSAPSGYTPGDTSAGDLDGDGQYDLVVKWEMSPQDNANAGTTGTVKLDGVKLDGTRLFRIDLGKNIREGAHYTQFLVYDLDGDGSSEIVVKTAPGTVDGKGKNVILGNDNPNADYRNGDGYVLTGPEYLTVFSGVDGSELATVPFEIARGTVSSWGDNYGNRVDRFVGAIAFVTADGRPSALMGRGYYTRATLTAWNYRDDTFSKVWTADSNANTHYTGQGSHGISIADVDGDNRQEVIWGAAMITSSGTRGCSTNLGHGDALHVGDFVPSRAGLEVFIPHEYSNSRAYSLRDAKTCEIIFQGAANNGNEGPGRGVAGDIDPNHAGAEFWTNSSDRLDEKGASLGGRPGSTNFLVWWDGDESRELLDGNHVDKFGGSRLLTADGCTSINGTKSTPNLSADLLGDWREEIVFRCGTNLRLYTTTAVTSRRIYTLMHDPQYRSAISWQQSAYNQPPHPSFHIGNGMKAPPKPDITVR